MLTELTHCNVLCALRKAARVKLFSVWLRYVHQGFFAFVNGGTENEDHSSWPSRVLKLGWAFFIVIALGSYTANLAAFLQGERVVAKSWQTMEDAAAAGKVSGALFLLL
jgi:hypothetical protein